MRNELTKALVKLADEKPFVFLTGDLGFMALEPLREKLKDRFINAGIAEQNMISMAAGLSLSGLQSWVYSIASFCYARPFEQIRNDLCLNRLPVKLLGNGGGYAYGSMGGSHHALEDYGILLSLENLHVFVPAFSADLPQLVQKMAASPYPNYARLGRCEKPEALALTTYAPWRCLLEGSGPIIVGVGPLMGPIWSYFASWPQSTRPAIWVVSELPLAAAPPPERFLVRLASARSWAVVEEHVAQGSFGQNLLYDLQLRGISLPPFVHAYARGYPSATYGSQQFHREESGLDPESIRKTLGL